MPRAIAALTPSATTRAGAFSIAARVFSILFFNFPFRKIYFRATLGKLYKPPVRPRSVLAGATSREDAALLDGLRLRREGELTKLGEACLELCREAGV
jgi:hypothetical protein